ncbi:hypothetical protein GYMLUDRAFT_91168 [Collybiopsis luxurians FD-317 M1]|nr:hypothetical protein GYMLUDRAFT_91168 [Collybiopsis luxurians FD-317 M1]
MWCVGDVEDSVRAAEKGSERALEGLGMAHEPDSGAGRVYDDAGDDDGIEYTHRTGETEYACGGVSSHK